MLLHRPARILVMIVLACLALSACAGGSSDTTVTIGGATASPGTVERPWGTVNKFPALQKAEKPHAADGQFAEQMAMHHEQAIVLSDIVLGHDPIDERIRAAAQFIKQDQSREIDVMQAWVAAWGDAIKPSEHGGHHMMMPGMVAQDRIDRLEKMSTNEVQGEFLRLMIEHHQGAIDMSKDYLDDGENAFTRSIAQHIIREQKLEIDYMNNILKEK